MIYYLDTEFIERPGLIQLISIGLQAADGRVYYAISNEYDESLANDWVKKNVIAKLEDRFEVPRKSLATIGRDIFSFVNPKWNNIEHKCTREEFDIIHKITEVHKIGPVAHPEFWAYYSHYDWVAFCQIFGDMSALPDGFPMYCRDLKQLMDQVGLPEEQMPFEPRGEHNALVDAKWNKQLHEAITEYQDSISGTFPLNVSLNDIYVKILYVKGKQVVVQYKPISDGYQFTVYMSATGTCARAVGQRGFDSLAKAQEFFRLFDSEAAAEFLTEDKLQYINHGKVAIG